MRSLVSFHFITRCSRLHLEPVAPKGKFIAFVSAEAESDNIQSELKPGIDLLGPVDELFFDMYDRYEPVNEPSLDNCFGSSVSFALYMTIQCWSHIVDVHGSFFFSFREEILTWILDVSEKIRCVALFKRAWFDPSTAINSRYKTRFVRACLQIAVQSLPLLFTDANRQGNLHSARKKKKYSREN